MPFFWVWLFLRGLFENYDAIHAHDFDTLIPGYFLAKIKGKFLVYDAHEKYTMSGGRTRYCLVSRVIDFIEQILSKNADIVITVSESGKPLFPNTKPIIIMNTKRKEDYEISADCLKKALKIYDPKKLSLLYIGGLSRFRRIDEIAECVSKIPFAEIIIAGNGRLKKQVIEIARKNKNVKYLGELPSKLVPNYTLAADIVVPTFFGSQHSWGLPNKLFESFAAGKPLLLFGEPGPSETKKVINNTKTGLYTKLNVRSVSKSLNELKENYKTYANNAKKAFETYNWNNEEKKLLNLYDELKNKCSTNKK